MSQTGQSRRLSNVLAMSASPSTTDMSLRGGGATRRHAMTRYVLSVRRSGESWPRYLPLWMGSLRATAPGGWPGEPDVMLPKVPAMMFTNEQAQPLAATLMCPPGSVVRVNRG